MIFATAHRERTKITGHALYRRTSGVYKRTLEAVQRCRKDSKLIVESHIIGVPEVDVADGTARVVHDGGRHGEDAQCFDEVLPVFNAQMGNREVRPLGT